MNRPSIAILAGGRSLRMGEDKACLPFDGMTLLERVARVGLESGHPVLIVGRKQPDDWAVHDVQFLPDEMSDAGPMGGLAAALRHSERVLTLACDMPLIDVAAIHWLCTASAEREFEDGLAVLNGVEIEPLFSVYAASCLPLIERRMAENRRSLRGLIEAGRFARVAAPPEVAARLVNLNTPDEYAALIDRINQES